MLDRFAAVLLLVIATAMVGCASTDKEMGDDASAGKGAMTPGPGQGAGSEDGAADGAKKGDGASTDTAIVPAAELYQRFAAAMADKKLPIEVDDALVRSVNQAINDRARAAFSVEGYEGRVYAAPANFGGVTHPDKITLVRYTEDDSRFIYVTITRNAKVFQYGGGMTEDRNPPWNVIFVR